jgi:hypothetical protein
LEKDEQANVSMFINGKIDAGFKQENEELKATNSKLDHGSIQNLKNLIEKKLK